MTPMLSEAVDAVRNLPPNEQDDIAMLIFAELADQRRWDDSFARSQPQLERMADKVRADIASGRVQAMGSALQRET